MAKKIFIYRNLHKNNYSIKRGSTVIERSTHILVSMNPTFSVSEAGRLRAIKEMQRNVHAGVIPAAMENVCFDETMVNYYHRCFIASKMELIRVTYNPYLYSHFTFKKDPTKKVSGAEAIFLLPSGCYVFNPF